MSARPNRSAPPSGDVADTEARILRAARVCFERHGFAKTTMDDIARETGISRPTIYNYFPGKAEIIERIGFEELDLINSVVRTRIGWQDSFAELATESIVSAVLVSQENQYIRQFVEALDVNTTRKAPSSAYETEARTRWQAILGRARASNELAADLEIEEVVDWIAANIVSLLRSADRFGDEDRLRAFARRFVIEPLLADRGN